MYIGYNAVWLMTIVHLQTKTKAQTKTKTKTNCSKDPTYVIFLKSRWFKDTKYGNMSNRPDQTRVSSVHSRTFLELVFLFICLEHPSIPASLVDSIHWICSDMLNELHGVVRCKLSAQEQECVCKNFISNKYKDKCKTNTNTT